MKLLTPKRKKILTTSAMWFGIAVFVAILVRVFRGGVTSAKGAAQAIAQEVKDTVRINSFILIALAALGICLDFYFGTVAGTTFAVALGTLTTGAGIVSTFNTTYVPQQFFYAAGTQLSGVKITVQGEGVIFDSDAAGLTHAGTWRVYGQVTNGFLFTLANGLITGKNVIWEFTNSAAQTPIVYVNSEQTPAAGTAMYLQLLRQAVLANSGQDFTKFAACHLPSLGATDIVNALYQDGTQQQLNRVDIQAELAQYQAIVNTPNYTIDNLGLNIKRINVLGAAQTAYIQRWAPAVSGGMISQMVNA